MKTIVIYTDGACSGNPGPGGYGIVLKLHTGKEIYISKYENSTTNNKMELQALIDALKLIPVQMKREVHIECFSDSKYVVDGINSWIINWKKCNWKTSNKLDVKNIDLWKELDSIVNSCIDISISWVKGHSTSKYNNICDKLATTAIANKSGEWYINDCIH